MPSHRPAYDGENEPLIAAFGKLDEAAQAERRDLCYTLAYCAGDLMCKVDMPPIGVFVIGWGMVKYGKTLSCEMRPPLLRLLGPGDVLGVEALFQQETGPSHHFARAMTDVRACFFPFDALSRFLERCPQALEGICTQLVSQLQRYECRLSEWTCGSVKVNVARLLLCLDARFGQPTPSGRVLTISRQDLADMMATHIDTVARVLSQFKGDEWIEAGPHHVTIRNEPKLIQAAAPLPSCLERARCGRPSPAQEPPCAPD